MRIKLGLKSDLGWDLRQTPQVAENLVLKLPVFRGIPAPSCPQQEALQLLESNRLLGLNPALLYMGGWSRHTLAEYISCNLDI